MSMGVYIKDMEMPKEGNWRSIRIYPDGTIGRPIGFGDYALVEGAKAVPVPPHGRLIDADELIKSLSLDEDDAENGASLLMAIFIEVLKAAPTIIPSDKESGE